MANGLACHYHLEMSTVLYRGIRSDFDIFFHFSMKFLQANRIAPGGKPYSAASHLALYCLPISNKKDARLYELKRLLFCDNLEKNY